MVRQEQAVTITPESVVAVFDEVNPDLVGFLGLEASKLVCAVAELRLRSHRQNFDQKLEVREAADHLLHTAFGGQPEHPLHEDKAVA
ncbi:MAG TPA: hypothetical protein VFI84_03850 [Candidatus Saccharimonadales bacterium]|nr:hypothetical protein [Candidatus Saccharimonadales bacterium]